MLGTVLKTLNILIHLILIKAYKESTVVIPFYRWGIEEQRLHNLYKAQIKK